MAPVRNIQRQAARPNHSSWPAPPATRARKASESRAMKMPVTMASCCNEPMRPRIDAGEISAM